MDITVCILTYKRPEQLRDCLDSLLKLNTEDLFCYKILVVDNDRDASAKTIVESFFERTDIEINYLHEEDKNIARARNHALDKTETRYLAFIDDDEHADKNWLLNLYKMAQEQEADIVNGPVHPDYKQKRNKLIIKSGFFNAYDYKDGQDDYLVKATGNCLLDLKFVKQAGVKFDENFGLSGGEDTLFFCDLEERGASFAWARQALAYEMIGEERQCFSWLLRRMFRVGNCLMHIKKQRKSAFFCLVFALALCAYIFVLFCLAPFVLLSLSVKNYFSWLNELIMAVGQISAILGFRYFEYKLG